MSFHVSKDNSLEISIPLELMKVHLTIGFMKVIMMQLGCSLSECGDGSSGKTVPMFFLLINLKLDGITFQTVALMWNKTPGKANTIQSMSITTISTLMSMSNLEKPEVLRVQAQANSYPRVSSVPKAAVGAGAAEAK